MYMAQYRCRKCHTEFTPGAGTGNERLARELIWTLSRGMKMLDETLAPKQFLDHTCAGGKGIGMADFIGWTTDE